MNLFNQLKIYIEVLAVVVAFGSAAFWFQAASINPPWIGMGTWEDLHRTCFSR